MIRHRNGARCAILALAVSITVWNATSQEFAPIKASTFSVIDEPSGLALPVHIDAFWIAKRELTQAEYARIMGRNPSKLQGELRPVENVTWAEAAEYCNRRSHREGLTLCYDDGGARQQSCTGYRLPTESEWLLAAGAGREGALPERLLSGAALYSGGNSVPEIRDAASAGTRPADPAASGIVDLVGNVWEWCEDRFNAVRIVDSVKNPRGPQTGRERVLRGGSFLTRAREWNKGFRSSMAPGARSGYVGFRIVRSSSSDDPTITVATASTIESVRSTLPARAPRQQQIREKWLRVLGQPVAADSAVRATNAEPVRESAWSGRLLSLTVEAEMPWRALLVLPAHQIGGRLPVVVIPYYDVDTPSGANLGGRNALPPGVRSVARLAAQFGMAAVCVRWSGENDAPGYYEAVADLAGRHPGVTGLGYWVWQARRLADWLAAQPEVDAERMGILGHSLGGKMALYAAAFEPRYRAVVSSEPGIAFAFSNYGDPWYLGERLALLPQGSDQHELLELIAPRPFLLIAGESADGTKSLPVLQKAAPAYAALGNPDSLAILNHRKGHSPTPEAVVDAMAWLSKQLRR